MTSSASTPYNGHVAGNSDAISWTDGTPQRPTEPFVPKPGDGWVQCRCGNRHWGINGAAGIFLVRSSQGRLEVLLQHRAPWSHQGGTWAVPGGAIMDSETRTAAALREAHEEAGLDPNSVEVLDTLVLDHVDWSYTTVIAVTRTDVPELHPTDSESLSVDWVSLNELLSESNKKDLLPAFAESLPDILALLHKHGLDLS